MYEGLVTLWRSMPTLCAIWGASTQLLHVDVCLWYLLVHQRKQAISILPRDGWTTCTDHRIVFSGTKRRSVAMSEPHPSNAFCRSWLRASSPLETLTKTFAIWSTSSMFVSTPVRHSCTLFL